MEGNATLTLTEAGSGRVVRKFTEHNLVTDAVKRILEPPLYTLINSFDFRNFTKNVMPVYKLFSGIVLLGNTLEERRDNVMIDNSCIPIATAGGPYSGTNVCRGSLNENETYATANGYHFTWDFGTDKANGVIKSIALTSRFFGDSGLGEVNAGAKIIMDPSNISGNYDVTTKICTGRGVYIGTYEDRTHIYVAYKDGKIMFVKYRSVDPLAIKINDISTTSIYADPVSITELELPFSYSSIMKFFVDPTKRVVYFFSSVYKDNGKNCVRYVGVDLKSFTFTESGTQDIGEKSSGYGAAVFDGKFYIFTTGGVSVYSLGGGLLKEYKTSFMSTSYFVVWEGILVMQYDTRAAGFFWNDRIYQFYIPENYLPMYSCDVKPPYYALSCLNGSIPYYDNFSINPYLGLASNYLATINNLNTPLEKTSEHNLKITYDITN